MPSMSIAAIELQEYLFAESLAKVAGNCQHESHNVVDWADLKRQTRQSFRLQRFAVMNWLLMNGVSIPAELLTDEAHPPVDEQYPDRTEVDP